MQRFRSFEQTQGFFSAHTFIHGHFHSRRHHPAAAAYRGIRFGAFDVWYQEHSHACTGAVLSSRLSVQS